jgi:toxin FitB
MAYLLDTNVLSEVKKLRPNRRVIDFLAQLSREQMHISVLTIGELRAGAIRLGRRDLVAGQGLLKWVESLQAEYHDRLVPVTTEIALLWGSLCADRSRPAVDTLLAATAIHHGLTFLTRNTRDVQDLPVNVLNPWLA